MAVQTGGLEVQFEHAEVYDMFQTSYINETQPTCLKFLSLEQRLTQQNWTYHM